MRSLLSIIFLLYSSLLNAQEYIANVQHFTQKDGLSHWNTNCVFQDSYGFIWIGTNYGLNRFDGHNFQIFTKEKNDLDFNEVHQILEDAEGWLWVFKCKNPRLFFRPEQLSFIHLQTLEVRSLEERFGKNSILEQKKLHQATNSDLKTIYIGTTEGEIIRFRPETGLQLYPTGIEGELSIDWVSDENLLHARIKSPKEEKQILKLDSLGQILSATNDQRLGYAFNDIRGRQWYWNRNRIRKNEKTPIQLFIKTKEGLQQVPIKNMPNGKQLRSAWGGNLYYREKDDAFWYASQNEFWVFHPEKGLLYDFEVAYPQILNNTIRSIFFDNRNYAWVATENGIYKIQFKQSPFQQFLSVPKKDYTVKKAISTRGLFVLNNKLWVNTIRPFQYCIDLTNENSEKLEFRQESRKRESAYVALNQYDTSTLVFASRHLRLYDVHTQMHRFIYRDFATKRPLIWSLFRDQHHTYWQGLQHKGLSFWDQEKGHLVNYKKYNDFQKLRESTVYAFLEWDAKHLLIGSTSGLYILHQKKGIIGHIALPSETIYHLHRDKQLPNIIWAATGGGGLIRMKLKETVIEIEDFKQFTTLDGLSSNTLYAVYEDDHKRLWLPSDYGIIRMNKNDLSVKAYTEEDGISHNEFNRASHFQTQSGHLYFGGLNGITTFHPDDILDEFLFADSPLRITNFQQYDGDQQKMVEKTVELLRHGKISLDSDDKLFNLEFALLEFQDSEQIRYSYKIEGLNEDWVLLNENHLRISGLPFGQFNLSVRAQSADGTYAKQHLLIPISVLRPFYYTWWFLSLSALLLLGGGLYLYQRRMHELRKQQTVLEKAVKDRTAQIATDKQTIEQQAKELKELDELKTRFFANVSHELRTPLTLMLAPIDSVLKRNELKNQDYTQLLLAQRNGQRLGKMINEILDLNKLEAGKLEVNERHVTWYSYLKTIIANFESLANRKEIEYQFQYEGNKALQVKLDKEKYEVIIVNLLSNAFKFTPKKGQITIIARDSGEQLVIEVKDTGRGIHTEDLPNIFNRFYQTKRKHTNAEGGTGIGLALSKELVQLMNGTIQVDSRLMQGSNFIVSIPRIEILGKLSDEEAIKLDEDRIAQDRGEMIPLSDSQLQDKEATILLVEDNYDLRRFIHSLLITQYRVQLAENGQDALDQLNASTEKVDLIISDVMMPIMDGYQLLELLKSDARYRHLPVVMLTARASKDDKLHALRIGVDDYMIKPFETEELLVRVENLLQNRLQRGHSQEVEDTRPKTHEEEDTKHKVSQEDLEWLEQLEQEVLNRLGQFEFSVTDLATTLITNRWQLNSRIKRLTGLTAQQYIQEARLNYARQLLETGTTSSVKHTAYEIGMKDLKYFSRQFKKRFGRIPSSYL